MIKFVDLDKQYDEIKTELDDAIKRVIADKAFINGPYVAEFEKCFAELENASYCTGCSSGTSALFLALKACGIKEGDEVITVPNTFIATAEAICHCQARPVFVDIDPYTYNIDPLKIENAITNKTKAILPVHLYGNPVNMSALMEIANKHNLNVIEDCSQSHLASYKGKKTGTFGDAGAFSFFPGKNLGAYGDAGAIITNDKNIANITKKLSDHGREEKYSHDLLGYNYRLDGIQAAILTVKSGYIKEWTKKRQENASLYNKILIQNKNIKTPIALPGAEHVYHLYVIQVNNRDEVVGYLKSKEISTSIHYPIPLHLQKTFEYLGYKKGSFPATEKTSLKILSIPMFPELSEEEIEFISEALIDIAKS